MITKVLVVDDEEQNRYLISYILRDGGYTVTESATGEEAVSLAHHEPFDLILMDIKLPGIDGFETTEQIRASATGRDVPIVALTSYAMKGDRERALAAGCNGYIEKPINPDTILVQLQKFITRRT